MSLEGDIHSLGSRIAVGLGTEALSDFEAIIEAIMDDKVEHDMCRQGDALERIATALEVIACSAMWRDHKDGEYESDFEDAAASSLKAALKLFEEARNGE